MLRAGAAALAVAAAAVAVLLLAGDDGPGHPDRWDERVAHLVGFVERERGHRFEHPVAVEFLDADAYAELARTDASTLTDEERAELADAEGLLRALGLVAGELDLLEAANDLSDTGTLARYDIEERRIIVRGTEMTPDLEVTLVHELTHALQDQVFGLSRLGELADDDDPATSGALFAFRALVEGDAGRIERAYLDRLDPEDRRAVEAVHREGLASLDAEEVPVALQALFGAPYALGEPFAGVLEARGVVDDAFRDPPTSQEHVLDPFSFLDGDDPVEVDPPQVGDVEVIDDGHLGAATLFLVLSERVEVAEAYEAALGWGGDAFVAYREGSGPSARTCVELAVTGDTAADTDELEAAIGRWARAAPAADASRRGEVVHLRSCDPGADAAGGSGSGIDALRHVAVRGTVLAQMLAIGAAEEQATCFADAVVATLSAEELAADDLDPDAERRLTQAAVACRVG